MSRSRAQRPGLPLATMVVAGAFLGCSKDRDKAELAPAPTMSASASEPTPGGPTVTIPAGVLKAGTTCGGIPRVTTEELEGQPIELGEFTIDVFPYPNDPSKPIRVDVSRDEAAALCAAEGKRLCTELEWERACKGPNNTPYEYGAGFAQQNCRALADRMPDKRPRCVSGFGVKDMHGLAWEWTSSPWGRGTDGDLATIRGGGGTSYTLQSRCANGQGKVPATKAKDIGFRCCSGTPTGAVVSVPQTRAAPLEEEPASEGPLLAALMKAMPLDHRAIKDVQVTFDKLWRWHPRDNEELVIGRWTGKPRDKPEFFEIAAFKVCNGVPSLLARTRGPSGTLGAPVAGDDPQKLTLQVSTGDDKAAVKLSYWYGSVQIDQPAWIKAGNTLAVPDDPKKPKIRPRPPKAPPKR